MKADSIEKIVEFLEKEGIKTIYNDTSNEGIFNRIIEFEVNDCTYLIEWYINQCYLYLNKKRGAPYVPFKFLAINLNSPRNRKELYFHDEETDETPWGCVRIPLLLLSWDKDD